MASQITAGLSVSVTGRYSRQGRQALDGLLLWESYINARGTMGPVRLIYYDDASRAAGARQNALRLLAEDRVDILFGPYSSALVLAVAQVAEERKKVLWNHGGSSDEIFNRGFRRLVSTASPASDYLRGLPPWLAKNAPGVRRICILCATTGTFAGHVARGVVEAAESLGIHSVELLPMGSSPGNAPEAVVLAGSFEDEIRMLEARRLWPETVRVVAGVAAGVQAFYQELQEGAEGVIGPSQWEPEPDSAWFVRSFRERFGSDPEYTAAGSFAMGLVVSECIRRAGSWENDPLREVAGQLDFDTFYGRFRIDPATGRQIGHRIRLVQWRQGRKVALV